MKRLLFIGLFILAIGWPSVRAAHAVIAPQHVLLAEAEEEEEGEVDDDRFENVVPSTIVEPSASPAVTTPDTNTSVSEVIPSAVTPEATNPVAEPTTTPTVAVAVPVISTDFPWAWILTRAAGIASYLLLTALSITGMLLTTGLLYRYMSPATAWSLHRAIGSVLLFSMLSHLVGIYLDGFIKLGLSDIFIPFVSHYQPVLVALGIFGFYLMLLVLASSLYVMTSHARFWRSVHFFGFPMFILIFLHGVLIGTDAQTWWMRTIYISTGVLVGAAIIYRMVWKYSARKQLPPSQAKPSG